MTDQEKLPEQRTLVSPPKQRKKTAAPRITSIINDDDEFIPNGGTSENDGLHFVGTADAHQWAEILDYGIQAHPHVRVDENRHFSAYLPEQTQGAHQYSVRVNGQVSEPWTVNIVTTAKIEWIYEPDGQPIENGGSTRSDDLSFVGWGEPNKTVKLLDHGELLQTLNVNDQSHWSALVEGLEIGNHVFTVQDEDGHVSAPWTVLVKESALLSTQFVIGKDHLQLIPHQAETNENTVTLVGTANPGEHGWIVDYEGDLVRFEADENGVYKATVEGLTNKVHTFRAKSVLGRLSTPWVIRVKS
ncbi:TPA: hypothetical protein ACKP2V_005000 [Pseudomonas putida]|jgi:hypothetical protein